MLLTHTSHTHKYIHTHTDIYTCINIHAYRYTHSYSTGQAKMDLRTTSTFPPASELKQHVPSSITFPASGKYVPPHMRLKTACKSFSWLFVIELRVCLAPAPANNNRQPAAAQPQSLARESEPVPGNHRLPDNPRCGCV